MGREFLSSEFQNIFYLFFIWQIVPQIQFNFNVMLGYFKESDLSKN